MLGSVSPLLISLFARRYGYIYRRSHSLRVIEVGVFLEILFCERAGILMYGVVLLLKDDSPAFLVESSLA